MMKRTALLLVLPALCAAQPYFAREVTVNGSGMVRLEDAGRNMEVQGEREEPVVASRIG